jgi:hypothetical protein
MRFRCFISNGDIPSLYRGSADYLRRSEFAETKIGEMYDSGGVNSDDRRDNNKFPGAVILKFRRKRRRLWDAAERDVAGDDADS